MKLGIMQPYFFPYLGYWQLLANVDQYVIYDDVNYIKGGWINRNRILNHGQVQYFRVQMSGASSYKHINEIEVQKNEVVVEKAKKTIFNAYHKAPEFENVYPIINSILDCQEQNLAKYLANHLNVICKYLGINTKLILSSDLYKRELLTGEEKVIYICQKLNAGVYYNAIGGRELYDVKKFKAEGIELHFLIPNLPEYDQGVKPFIPGLSIIDVMMNNSVSRIQEMLTDFTLT